MLRLSPLFVTACVAAGITNSGLAFAAPGPKDRPGEAERRQLQHRVEELGKQLAGAFERFKVGKDDADSFVELRERFTVARIKAAANQEQRIEAALNAVRDFWIAESQVNQLVAAGILTRDDQAKVTAARDKAQSVLKSLTGE
jgi:hypothetical protein